MNHENTSQIPSVSYFIKNFRMFTVEKCFNSYFIKNFNPFAIYPKDMAAGADRGYLFQILAIYPDAIPDSGYTLDITSSIYFKADQDTHTPHQIIYSYAYNINLPLTIPHQIHISY